MQVPRGVGAQDGDAHAQHHRPYAGQAAKPVQANGRHRDGNQNEDRLDGQGISGAALRVDEGRPAGGAAQNLRQVEPAGGDKRGLDELGKRRGVAAEY